VIQTSNGGGLDGSFRFDGLRVVGNSAPAPEQSSRSCAGGRSTCSERDILAALLMFTLERTCDAIAQGDVADLGLDREFLEARLRSVIQTALT